MSEMLVGLSFFSPLLKDFLFTPFNCFFIFLEYFNTMQISIVMTGLVLFQIEFSIKAFGTISSQMPLSFP